MCLPKPASPSGAPADEPAPEVEPAPDIDSAGVYFLSIEEFEGRSRPAPPAKPEPEGPPEPEPPESE